ncbi:hypothetical protein LTR64_003373 [Lithohypha guttulata]|uniref:uncharacterized protein n=1 Tax=Lithohypha guttulata TaxID=1690604 RepID=UPI002DDFF8A7|nr:hypothetical protein LTR51_000408 [Lithohypha guttulata]
MVMDMTGPAPTLQLDMSITNDLHIKGFETLGGQIFYYRPNTSSDQQNMKKTSSPDLIIICSWLYARQRHIAQYSETYRRIYPQSRILLLKQDGPDLIWRPNAWQMQEMKPAVKVIKELEAGAKGRPSILLHSFSNGGAFTSCQLADAYALHCAGELLPISAVVIDSAPSIPTARVGWTAMSQGFPPSLPAPVLGTLGRLAGIEGSMTGLRRKLNDSAGSFMQEGLKRVYIYSDTDELVPWTHVEAHAQEAKEVLRSNRGEEAAKLVQLEKFVGSKHVAHAVMDGERYWNIVQQLWEGLEATEQPQHKEKP